MIPDWRELFNKWCTEDKYRLFLDDLKSMVGGTISFRPSETPVFLPRELIDEMIDSSLAIISQLDTPHYFDLSTRSVPDNFKAPNEGSRPHFVQVDFALVKNVSGHIVPRLIELQGCASIYAFQYVLAQCFRKHYDLQDLRYLLGDIDENQYVHLLKQTILNDHSPELVVLMEIDPINQKTHPDFVATQKLTGVRMVCITDLIRQGRRLFYRHNGQLIPIQRIYNRVIIDELVEKQITPCFDFRDDLDVEWAGHPNWYFRWSKFSLPYLKHPTVPPTTFYDQFENLPSEPGRYVLKPLYSFAGTGVKVGPSREDLEAIPVEQRRNYILQERVNYAQLIETPNEPCQVEIRIMFLWPDNSTPIPVITLARLSRGLMMGVNFNQDQTWVGSSIAFFI